MAKSSARIAKFVRRAAQRTLWAVRPVPAWPTPPTVANDPADPILVLGSGQRCGSTLVQRLLSSHPDVLVWGEHGGQLRRLRELERALEGWDEGLGRSGREAFLREGHQSFMANLMPAPEAIRQATREYVSTLFAVQAAALGRKRWGFKEIRYGRDELDWLATLFPGLKGVHVTRDPRDVLVSLDHWERSATPWQRSQTREALGDWLRVNRDMLERDSSSQPPMLSVRYEDIVLRPEEFIRAVGEFLDLDHRALDAAVFRRQVHTGGPSGTRPRQLRHFAELAPELRALVSRPEMIEVAGAYGYAIEREP